MIVCFRLRGCDSLTIATLDRDFLLRDVVPAAVCRPDHPPRTETLSGTHWTTIAILLTGNEPCIPSFSTTWSTITWNGVRSSALSTWNWGDRRRSVAN